MSATALTCSMADCPTTSFNVVGRNIWVSGVVMELIVDIMYRFYEIAETIMEILCECRVLWIRDEWHMSA